MGPEIYIIVIPEIVGIRFNGGIITMILCAADEGNQESWYLGFLQDLHQDGNEKPVIKLVDL